MLNLHFGVDYYPEHWDENRWENDCTRDIVIEIAPSADSCGKGIDILAIACTNY